MDIRDIKMDTEVLWKELRAQQVYTRDKASFEQFDRIFLQELLDSLKKYIDTVVDSVKIPDLADLLSNHEKIEQKKELSQLQIALLHHASSIQHLSIIISKVFEKSKKKPGSFTLFNPEHYLKVLPKLEIFKEFISDRVRRYGQYLGELQTVDPAVFRVFSLITKNAQKQFSLHMFHTLVKLLPYTLSSKSISDQVSNISANILQKLYSETPHISKYKKIWQYFKQLFKDTKFNLILNTLDGLQIDKYIGKHFSGFLASKTDDISEYCLTMHAVELTDLASTLNIKITGQYFADLIKCTKSERYCQLNESLFALEKMISLSNRELEIDQIQELINTIELLTPLDIDQKTGLKDKFDCDKTLIFSQSIVTPLLRELKCLTAGSKISEATYNHIKKILRQLFASLEYTQAVVNKNIRALITTLDEKITLCKAYPDLDALNSIITEMSILIQKNTTTDIIGRKEKKALAILAETKRRDLMNLLKARVEIQLQNQPSPDIEHWDTFLFSDSGAPLYQSNTWANCFYAFTFTNTSPRFSALLADQIASLNKLDHYKHSIDYLFDNNKDYLSKEDYCELKQDRIVGLNHLKELSDRITEKYNKLSAYILYLQIESIGSILKHYAIINPTLNTLRNSFQSWSLQIKTEAAEHHYNILLPKIAIFDNYIKQISSVNSEKILIPSKTQEQILDTLERLKLFFYGNSEQKLAAASIKTRDLVHVEKISLFRQLLLNLLKFIELCVSKVKNIFSSSISSDSTSTEKTTPSTEGLCMYKLFINKDQVSSSKDTVETKSHISIKVA